MEPAALPEAHQVHDKVWVSTGLTHSYMVSTTDGRVLIGAGMGFESPVHKRNFDAVDPSPTRALIFTQGHPDHVGGADHLAESDTAIVAHANQAEHLVQDARLAAYRKNHSDFAFSSTVRDGALRILDEFGFLPEQATPTPTLTFEHQLHLTFGDTDFELISTPGGETFDSVVVWLPGERILFTGNLFSALTGHIPNLVTLRGDRYRQPLMFIDSVNRVLELDVETLLPGHHGPIVGAEYIRSELTRVRDATAWVHERTVDAMNAGESLWEVMQTIELPSELEVGEGYGKVSWDVRAIWEQYAGWFKHESTSELYGHPAHAVNPAMVALAGGPDPVVERARVALADAEPVLAIQLAEAALSVDPAHRGACQLMVEAHRHLLETSSNFWLTSWLEHQVRRFDQ